MPDIVASQLPPGAGRFQDFVWPDQVTAATAGAGAQHRPRNGSAAAPGTNVAIGGGTGPLVEVVAGVPYQRLFSNVGVGNQRLMYPGFPVMLRTSRSNIGPAVDDCAVYRFVINMCGNGTAVAAGHDWGFELVAYRGAVASRINADAVNGIGLRIQNANVVQLLVRGPNGLVVTDLTAAPFITTAVWHSFDMRFFSATATEDARWTLRIDGAPVALSDVNSSWGAVGTNLPAVPLTGATVGFVPSIVSAANNLNELLVQQLHLMCAPNELNCL